MFADWFDAREATRAGCTLADRIGCQLAPRTEQQGNRQKPGNSAAAVHEVLRHAMAELLPSRLNLYKKAKLANSFKWRLTELGLDSRLAREMSHALTLQLITARQPAASNNHGWTMLTLGRVRDAEHSFKSALDTSPNHLEAMLGMGHVLRAKGRFRQAEAQFHKLLRLSPAYPGAWAALSGMRRMTEADAAWLEGAREICNGRISRAERAELLFAIGKYYDDLKQFELAFRSIERANRLQKSCAVPYSRKARARFVDDMIRSWPSADAGAGSGSGSESATPVFIVGMPRSGTSLVEHIVASHPGARGLGELGFWNDWARTHESDIRRGAVDAALVREAAESYLRLIGPAACGAQRAVDKAPVNANHLGLIHRALPHARIINMRRDPVDTCLSCYFQHFPLSLNYTMHLADLAHYCREHHRLMAHWRRILPPAVFLDVPYEELVAAQETWTRRILDFLELPWDPRCMRFHETERSVGTASFWQVRQPMYPESVGRSRNYAEFIAPLRSLDCR